MPPRADGKLVIGGLKPALHQFLRNAPHNHGCSFGQTGKQMGKPRRFHFAAAHLLFCILFQQAGKALFQFCLFHGSNLPGAVFPEDGFKKEVHYASVFQSIQGGGAPLFGTEAEAAEILESALIKPLYLCGGKRHRVAEQRTRQLLFFHAGRPWPEARSNAARRDA